MRLHRRKFSSFSTRSHTPFFPMRQFGVIQSPLPAAKAPPAALLPRRRVPASAPGKPLPLTYLSCRALLCRKFSSIRSKCSAEVLPPRAVATCKRSGCWEWRLLEPGAHWPGNLLLTGCGKGLLRPSRSSRRGGERGGHSLLENRRPGSRPAGSEDWMPTAAVSAEPACSPAVFRNFSAARAKSHKCLLSTYFGADTVLSTEEIAVKN